MFTRTISIATLLVLLVACTSSEIGNSKDVNPQTIFIQYAVSYTEGDETAACTAQFRFAGDEGTTLVLNDPAKLLLDGSSMKLDSSELAGAYYTQNFPYRDFAGRHSFSFSNGDGKSYEEDFDFKPFALGKNMPADVNKDQELNIPITGLDDGDILQLRITDSAENTEDISRVDTIRNGNISIQSYLLKQLSSGPLTIQIERSASHPLQQSTNEGGNFEMKYSLKGRECILHD